MNLIEPFDPTTSQNEQVGNEEDDDGMDFQDSNLLSEQIVTHQHGVLYLPSFKP
jgi:hypothetical protein